MGCCCDLTGVVYFKNAFAVIFLKCLLTLMKERQPRLDILRFIAIILVMLRHYNIYPLLKKMGWIGVDLFFVLSGFLVSGLLFQEFKKAGKINGMLFFIRRGFKIYPTFWFVLILYIFYFNYKGISYSFNQIMAELFFVQNFIPGIIGITWTLAIEEHFYFLLIILVIISIKYKWLNSRG